MRARQRDARAARRVVAGGARGQQLVFIGVGLERHRRAIEAALDDCLLRDRELELFLLTDDAQRRYNFPGLEELQAAGNEP